MGGAVAKMLFKTGKDKFEQTKFVSLNDIEVHTIDGVKSKMGDFV